MVSVLLTLNKVAHCFGVYTADFQKVTNGWDFAKQND